jgi:4,5-DOPA dioxygenase extradiol
MQAMAALPSLFVSHGSPMIALQPGAAGQAMLALGERWRAVFGRPSAIVAVSAHTLARVPVALAAAQHAAVYDFGNFDPRLNRLRYDVTGAPALAEQLAQRLRAAGWPAQTAAQAGLDHGIWTALRYLFPAADVPVLPLAWPAHADATTLLQLGQTLAPLRQQGVLILGTGSITHNLQRVFSRGLLDDGQQPEDADSAAFRHWFAVRAEGGDWPALLDWERQAPHARAMHPSTEHLLPWFVAAGAAFGGTESGNQSAVDAAATVQRLYSGHTFGCLGMDSYAFGAAALALRTDF